MCFVNAKGASERIFSLVLVSDEFFLCRKSHKVLRFIMKAVISACILMLCGSSVAVKFRECLLLQQFQFLLVLFLNHFCFSPNWISFAASDIVRCRKGDSECIVKSANEVLKLYSRGSLLFLSLRILIWILDKNVCLFTFALRWWSKYKFVAIGPIEYTTDKHRTRRRKFG